MLQLILKIFLITAFPSHKFYLSITEIRYSEDSKSFQIALKIFTDDLESTLKLKNNVYLDLFSPQENSKSDSLIFRYINNNLKLRNNNNALSLKWIGKEQEADAIWIYVESSPVLSFKSVFVENSILTSLFEQQQNIVNFYYKKSRQSYIFDSENPKYTFKIE